MGQNPEPRTESRGLGSRVKVKLFSYLGRLADQFVVEVHSSSVFGVFCGCGSC